MLKDGRIFAPVISHDMIGYWNSLHCVFALQCFLDHLTLQSCGFQFFLTLAPNIDYLDGKHTVFGEVAEGFDVLQKFNEVYVDKDKRPYQDIRSAV